MDNLTDKAGILRWTFQVFKISCFWFQLPAQLVANTDDRHDRHDQRISGSLHVGPWAVVTIWNDLKQRLWFAGRRSSVHWHETCCLHVQHERSQFTCRPGSNRQRALRKRNFVVMGFVMKVLWQDHTFVMKCTLNALCLMWNCRCLSSSPFPFMGMFDFDEDLIPLIQSTRGKTFQTPYYIPECLLLYIILWP